MKKCIRKILFSIIVLGIAIISPNVHAASATITASAATVYVGDSASFTVTVNGAAWDVYVTGAVSGSIVGYNADGINQTTPQSFALNTSTPGVYTASISGSVTEQDSDESTPVGGSATITVIERPAPPPVTPAPVTPTVPTVPTTPTTPTNPNPGGTTNENTNINNADSNANNNTTVTNPEEKNPTVEKEQPKEPKPLDITKFEILGYDIKFKNDVTNYELKIDKNLKKLYLVIEGNEISVEGNGIVDITNKDKIVVKIKNSEQEVDYTINLKKQALGAVVQTEDRGNIFIATTIIFGWSTIILAIFLVKDITKYKKTKQEQSL